MTPVTGGGGGGSTLDLLGFENVRDGGVIETPAAYTMLIEIEPREWLTLSEERRNSLYVSYMTFLRGLQFPTQFLTLTTRFNGDQYIEKFVGVDAPGAPTGEPTSAVDAQDDADEPATDGGTPVGSASDRVTDSPLLEYGRIAHAEWLDRTIALANVRDRRFFVAVAVRKGEDEEAGRFDFIADALPFGNRSTAVDDEAPYLDEVWARVQRVASQLPRTQVETTILDDRADVLDILYQVYRGQEAPIAFEHGVFTRPDETTLTDPETGEPLDLAAAFEEADLEGTLTDPESAPEPRPESTGDLPYDGRVQEEYIDQVDNSRLLAWYARTIGPIGRGTHYHSPLSVYAGVTLFTMAILFAVTSLGAFLGGSSVGGIPYRIVREVSFGLAAGSLPTFLLSLVVLLPSDRRSTAIGLAGVGVTAVAVGLFERAYPAQWTSTPTGTTALVVEVYAAGLFLLVVGVALALRARRSALDKIDDDVGTPAGSTVDENLGGTGPPEGTDV